MIMNDINQSDIDALWDYIDGPAQVLTGMTYAQGLQEMLDWLTGNSPRPGEEEE